MTMSGMIGIMTMGGDKDITVGLNRFAVVDFETMDTCRYTVCAVGVAILDNGEIVDKFYSLVCPPTKYENKYCVETHGLTYNDVKNSPSFDKVWEKVDRMIGDSPIVAHNSPFEKSCIEACGEEFGTKTDYQYIDTLKMSRELFPGARNHKLDTLCEGLGVELTNHHNALEDAVATAECFREMVSMKSKNKKKKKNMY